MSLQLLASFIHKVQQITQVCKTRKKEGWQRIKRKISEIQADTQSIQLIGKDFYNNYYKYIIENDYYKYVTENEMLSQAQLTREKKSRRLLLSS